MGGPWPRRLLGALLALMVVAAVAWALRPQPVPADIATIARGDLLVTVDEEARTRIREIYTVSAPLAGKVRRSPREVGDEVIAGTTPIALIEPAAPAFLDVRARREAESTIAAAEAAVELARAQLREAEAQLTHYQSEFNRAEQLRRQQAIAETRLEEARLALSTADARLMSAQATLEVRQRELDSARARLIGPEMETEVSGDDICCIVLRAPIDGTVLDIIHRSEQVVQVGTALIDIGDPRDLEIVAELLSSDAVRLRPGAEATVDGWGGPRDLPARVRRIEPAGFTKVSALGIEEQRVRVLLDFEAPPEERDGLGHDYRVMVRITDQRHEEVVLVPISALFRRGSDWSVYLVDGDGTVSLRTVGIGARTSREAMVIDGLAEGDRVVMHPGDRISPGVRVTPRDGGA